MDLRNTSVAELATQVQAKELSARELITHSLAEIERLNPQLNAFCAVDGERALADAAAIDERIVSGEQVGPLAGIPLAVKDLEHAIGFVTTHGSALHTDDRPAEVDSVHVARLKAAGCVVIGKTNTPEHGHKGVTDNVPFGPTKNPWNTDHNPGGSSGGSAAALASGMVPLATGTDAGGSIRIPSSLCGLSGIKLSQGRIPQGGATPPGSTVLGVRGPMALRIRDVAMAIDVSVGPDPNDVFAFPGLHDPWWPQLESVDPPPVVAYSKDMGFAAVDREVAAAFEAALRVLADAGTEVIEAPSVFDTDPVMSWFQLWCASRARTQGHLRDTPDWERIDPGLRRMIEYGLELSAVDVVRALDACHELNLRLESTAFDAAPILLCPTLAGQAPLTGHDGTVNGVETPSWVSFTPFVNLTRNPAGTVNVGFTEAGLPIGMQVIGRQRQDLDVLRTVAFVEDLMAFDRLAPSG